jgi:hypothetical protein
MKTAYMYKYVLVLLVSFSSFMLHAQEFNCQVQVSSAQIEGTEKKVYQTLQQALYEFINNRKWTNLAYKPEERIECTILVTVNERVSSDMFKGKLNLVLQRPIYKTSYNSTVFNYVDKDFDFNYLESQNLEYSPDAFTSNLTSVIAFYLNIFLGIDGDTFTKYGGTAYFEKAQAIVNTAQNVPEKGWKAFESQKNRYWLVENLLNSSYSGIREGLYDYHRLGLDMMTENIELGRSGVTDCIDLFQTANRARPGLYLLQLMLDAKRDEIINIYSQAAPQDKVKIIAVLKEIDPANGAKYQKIMESK